MELDPQAMSEPLVLAGAGLAVGLLAGPQDLVLSACLAEWVSRCWACSSLWRFASGLTGPVWRMSAGCKAEAGDSALLRPTGRARTAS
jgi:hypothetical protein